MGRVATRSLAGLFVFFVYISLAYAAGSIVSPFNKLALDLNENSPEYSFLIGGHLYGAQGTASVFPAPSILAHVETINTSGAKFFVSLGDNYRSYEPIHISNYQSAFSSKLKMPLFNAVGNHDIKDHASYEAKFGKTYYHFVYNNDLFIFLDSELDQGKIVNDQLDYFLTTLRHEGARSEIKNVFIFSHKLIWNVNNPVYQIIFENANEGYPDNNFKTEIEPLLIGLSKQKSLYWVSGDIGLHRSLPLFYNKDLDHNITYIAAGIGDTERDAILRVSVSNSKGVVFTPISLTGQKLLSIENYGLDYWNSHFVVKEPTFVERRLKNLTVMVYDKYFWVGLGVGLALSSLLIIFLRRYNR